KRRADAVGQIGDDARGRGEMERSIVHSPGVSGDDIEPPGIERGNRLKRREAALVLFDGDDAGGAFEQKRAGEAAGTGADLDHCHALERAGGAGDASREIEVEQEVLAETLLGGEPRCPDYLAKRGQSVGRAQERSSAMRLMASASLSASIRLRGLALPVPARANAVP